MFLRICWGRICIPFVATLSSLPSLSEFGDLQRWLLAFFKITSMLLSAVCVIEHQCPKVVPFLPNTTCYLVVLVTEGFHQHMS